MKATLVAVSTVLILVLVEHTLGELNISFDNYNIFVLILVLVEHTLGAVTKLRRVLL